MRAFKAFHTPSKILCKNIEINRYTNIIPVQKSVSNKQGQVGLWVDKGGIALSSFAKDNVIAFSKAHVEGWSEKPISLNVETISLDEFFKNRSNKIDFIKIDTQGAEGLIVEGAEKLLKSNILNLTDFFN